MKLPTPGGICPSCDDYKECPVSQMLRAWKDAVKRCEGNEVEAQKWFPNVYKDCKVDEPNFVNGNVSWCPMYSKIKKIKNAEFYISDPYQSSGSPKTKLEIIGTAKRDKRTKDNNLKFYIDGVKNMKETTYSMKFEDIDSITSRLKVPGGWLIRSNDSNGFDGRCTVHTLFFADPNYDWKFDYNTKE